MSDRILYKGLKSKVMAAASADITFDFSPLYRIRSDMRSAS